MPKKKSKPQNRILTNMFESLTVIQPVREAVSYRGLFTVGWFSVREKHYFRLKIYDRLRGNEQV